MRRNLQKYLNNKAPLDGTNVYVNIALGISTYKIDFSVRTIDPSIHGTSKFLYVLKLLQVAFHSWIFFQ